MTAKLKPHHILLALFLCTLLSSVLGFYLEDDLSELDRQLDGLTAQIQKQSAQNQGLRQAIDAWSRSQEDSQKTLEATKPFPIDVALSVGLSKIQTLAINHLISFSQISPALISGNNRVPLDSMAKITASDLKVISILVKGQYKSLDELNSFFSELPSNGIGIAKIKLTNDQFEAQLDIFGI